MQNEPLEVTLKVTRVFEQLGVPYLIGGSLASILYGMIRLTQDADIVAEMRLEHLAPFVDALQGEGMKSEVFEKHWLDEMRLLAKETTSGSAIDVVSSNQTTGQSFVSQPGLSGQSNFIRLGKSIAAERYCKWKW